MSLSVVECEPTLDGARGAVEVVTDDLVGHCVGVVSWLEASALRLSRLRIPYTIMLSSAIANKKGAWCPLVSYAAASAPSISSNQVLGKALERLSWARSARS